MQKIDQRKRHRHQRQFLSVNGREVKKMIQEEERLTREGNRQEKMEFEEFYDDE